MKEIISIIDKVENGEMELASDYDFYQEKFLDRKNELFIIHKVKNNIEVELFFAEHSHVKDMNEQERTEFFNDYNELADQFNYNDVVAYCIDGEIVWRGERQWL